MLIFHFLIRLIYIRGALIRFTQKIAFQIPALIDFEFFHIQKTLALPMNCQKMEKTPLAQSSIYIQIFVIDKLFRLILFTMESKCFEFRGKFNKILIAFEKYRLVRLKTKTSNDACMNGWGKSDWCKANRSSKLFAHHIACPNGMMKLFFHYLLWSCVALCTVSLCYLLSNYILHSAESSGHPLIVHEGSSPSIWGSTNSSNYHHFPLAFATFCKKSAVNACCFRECQ